MTHRFPDLGEWHPTRRSLHAWSRLLSSIRGALCDPHPRWWHISLTVTPRGLSTGPLAGGGAASGPIVELDLERHELTLRAEDRLQDSVSLTGPPTVRELAGWLSPRLHTALGRRIERAEAWNDGSSRRYEPAAAARYRQAVSAASELLTSLRNEVPGERGPVQLWAHHFDLAFELFGRRQVEDQGASQPAQIGFGFYPGDDDDPRAYFYGTPWPFADRLLESPLPPPAAWQREPWEGARLPYSAAIGDRRLAGDFLRAVYASGRSVLEE